MLGRAYTTGHTNTDHESVRGFETRRLTLVNCVTVVLHVGSMELGQLRVRLTNATSRSILQTLTDRTTEIVTRHLDVLVRDRLRLCLSDGNRVNAKRFPELGLPCLVACLPAICILVVTQT